MTPSLWNNHVPACSHNEIAPKTSRNLWGGEGWLCSEAAPMCRLWFSKAAVRPPTKENGNNMLISGPFHAPKTQAEPGIRACDCHMTRADGALTRLHQHSGMRAVPRARSVGWAPVLCLLTNSKFFYSSCNTGVASHSSAFGREEKKMQQSWCKDLQVGLHFNISIRLSAYGRAVLVFVLSVYSSQCTNMIRTISSVEMHACTVP